ncbi:MAG: glycosyltransferase family 2 protein [Oscillospiraceae bacterium]|nr:glycosyltransferase family 2 protein [Oscillospiraceae bacterium]
MIVSICTIALNESAVLNGLFRDISQQDYPHENIEVVFVDSMSKDNTREMMEDFKNTHYSFKDVKIVENHGNNQASGWNQALKNATGDIIIRVDAHASIPRNFVSKNVLHIKEGENVTGGGRPNIVSGVSPWKLTLLAAEESLFGSSIASYRRQTTEKQYQDSMFHAAYKREVFATVGGFNEALGRTEDNEIHYRIRQAGYKLCCCPDIISYQMTRNTLKDMIRQKYGNGKWIGLTLGVCKECLSYFHFVPFLFVMAVLGSVLLSFLGLPIFLIALGCVYGIFDIVNTATCFITRKVYPHFLLLPLLFPLLHIVYGVGTIVGLIKLPFWKRSLDGSAEKKIEEVRQAVIHNTK